MFEGTVTIKDNPIATIGKRYSRTFDPVFVPGKEGYRGLDKEDRADGNYWRLNFILTGGTTFLSYMMDIALGKMVEVYDVEKQPMGEYLIYEMELDNGVAAYHRTLSDMYNTVRMRYRLIGESEYSVTDNLTHAGSIARYGVREYTMSGGEQADESVAEQKAQRFLDAHHTPKKIPGQIGLSGEGSTSQVKGVTDRPHIKVACRGFADTLDWETYDSAAEGWTIATTMLDTLFTAKGQYIESHTLGVNNTPVTTKYQMGRKVGDIAKSIVSLGDAANQRWVLYWKMGRRVVYKAAAPARLKAEEI
jgi:hypothetical protein